MVSGFAPAECQGRSRDASIPKNERETLSASMAGAQVLVSPVAGHMLPAEEPKHLDSDLAAFVFGLSPE